MKELPKMKKTMEGSFKSCLNELLHLDDVTEEIKEKVQELKTCFTQKTEKENKVGGNTYYGIVIQGECNIVSIKSSRQRDEDSDNEGPSSKRLNVGVEESSDEENPRSDLNGDYYPQRKLDYELEEVSCSWNTDSTEDLRSNDEEDWIAKGFNVSKSLDKFRRISSKMPTKALSDMRVLSLSHIFLFTLLSSESVTRYMDIYSSDDENGDEAELILDAINKDLVVTGGSVTLSSNISKWADQLSQASTSITNWFDIQRVTMPFIREALENNDEIEIIAANIMHRLALNFSNKSRSMKPEDSSAHNIVSIIFEAVFQSDPLLSYQWANVFLMSSDKYKPDFIIFDVGVSEIKSPHNKGGHNITESDHVKIGKEMAYMINYLIMEGVNSPVVGGILLKDYKMKTYKMDLKYPKVYRMIELSSINICDNLQGCVSLPAILRNVIQLKNIVKKTAVNAKRRAIEKSEGIPPGASLQKSYMVSLPYNLRQNVKKNK